MRARLVGLLLIVGVVSLMWSSDVAASENPRELQGSTLLVQTATTAGMTGLSVGTGMWLASYRFEMPEASSRRAWLVYRPLGIVGMSMMVLSVAMPSAAINIVGNDTGPTYILDAFLGAILGGVAGTLGARAINDNRWRFSSLDWHDRRMRTGLVVGAPIMAGLTIGGMAGYLFQRRRTDVTLRGDEEMAADQEPAVVPTVGTPVGADDDGWTVGASIRF